MKKKGIVLTLGLGAIAAALIAVFGLLRPKTLDGAASAVMEAFLNNDPATVYEYSHRHQKEVISRDQFVAAWHSIVEPVMKEYKPVGKPQIEVSPVLLHGSALIKLRNAQGNETELLVTIRPSDDGPAFDLMEAFTTAWYAKWAAKPNEKARSFTEACALGMAADAEALRRAGIDSIPSPHPEEKPVPLDECIAHLRKSAQEVAMQKQERSRHQH